MRRLRADLELSELVRLLPAAGVLGVWIFEMFDAGGYRPRTWLPAGLVVLAMLFLAVASSGRLLPEDRAVRRPLLALLAFCAWCFASMAWSDAPGTAWEAANLLLVAVAGAWTLALAPWRVRTAHVLFVAFSTAAAVACLAGILSALNAVDLTARFEDFRFSPPLDYPNTTAAFAFMAALPALVLAARPDASVLAKALGQGLATFLCAYALLPQSRGSILGGLAAIVVLAVVAPFRWRLALHALLLVIAVVAAAGPVGAVYTAAAETGRASDALQDALTAILLATTVATLAGAGLALAEQRVTIGARGARTARIGALVVAGLLVVTLGVAGIAKSSSIRSELSDQWQALKHPGERFGGEKANAASGRLTSTDPLERYDYWRVALDGFRANPLGGMGAGGFEHRYALDRRYPKPSRYPHNVVMKVVGDTGIVGVGLMGAFVALIAGGLVAGARRMEHRQRMVAAVGAATFAYFLAHGLFDWLETYPVLVGPALAFPLVALAVAGRVDGGDPPERVSQLSVPVSAAAGVILLAAFASLLMPWFGLRYSEHATDTWRTDPVRAYRDLDRAADIDPLSPRPLVLRGVIAISRGDYSVAEDAFESALEREQAWLGHFGLALVAGEAGDRERMDRELTIALRQHPQDTVLPDVAERMRKQSRIDPPALLKEALSAPQAERERIS